MKKSRVSKKANHRELKQSQQAAKSLSNPAEQGRRVEWVFMGVLLAAGVYLSVVYFGQKAVPNSDFTAFVQTGDDVLHFRLPASFKRVPVLGVLQIAVSQLMFTSPHPVLTGGLVLNGILYPLSILLFYKICRFFLEPTGSFCLCLIAALNPWSLMMVVDPIAETTIVFFVLLTLYLILRRSRWCYLAAMLASMTRHECFGLIGIALLFDLLGRSSKRHKLTAAGVAFAAAIPMMLWMVGTKLTTTDPNSTYFKHFLDVQHRNGFDLLKMLWTTSFSPLVQWPQWIRAVLLEQPATQQAANVIQSHNRLFGVVWNSVTAAFFIAGVAGCFLKKQWRYLGILLFWAGYVGIHMSQSVLIDRYTVPVIWLTLLTAMYGLTCSVQRPAGRIPKGFLYAAAGIGAAFALVWTFQLWPAIPQTAKISPASRNVVYAGLLLTLVAVTGKQWILRGRSIAGDVGLFGVMALVIVSNQFPLSFRLGQGDLDIEFRKTADWYLENAEDGEQLATTLPGVVNLFLPEGRRNAIHTGGMAGKNLLEFARTCKQRQVLYVAWDSRLGLAVKGEYYKSWGLEKIHPLGGGKDVGPFHFIRRIDANPRRYIYLYRLDFEQVP